MTAPVLREALRPQSRRALALLFEQLHELGARAVARRDLLVTSPTGVRALAQLAGHIDQHRQDEPYRRAIAGLIARLSATAACSAHNDPAQAVGARCRLTRRPRSLPTTSASFIVRSKRTARRSWRAGGFVRSAAPSTFLASTSPAIDLRQNADVHERAVAELSGARPDRPATRSSTKPAASSALLAALGSVAPLVRAHSSYSDETKRELAIVHAAREAHRLYGTAVGRRTT